MPSQQHVNEHMYRHDGSSADSQSPLSWACAQTSFSSASPMLQSRLTPAHGVGAEVGAEVVRLEMVTVEVAVVVNVDSCVVVRVEVRVVVAVEV